eukprot:scaffold114475_cov42-Attheya_sp.AAC.1
MASDDPAAVHARVDELEEELRSIVLQFAQGLVQQNNVVPEEQEEQIVSCLLRYVQSARRISPSGTCILWFILGCRCLKGAVFVIGGFVGCGATAVGWGGQTVDLVQIFPRFDGHGAAPGSGTVSMLSSVCGGC